MTKNNYYINGIGMISPQRTFDNSEFLPEITEYNANTLQCVVPDFKSFIPPNQIRRLNRMLRIGLSAAMICFKDSKETQPDGIISATGYGLLTETEKFLTEIIQQEEKHLTPTFFMQSTYNAMAGLVGLSLKCTGYNNTFASKGFAFELALHDAIMQLHEDESQTLMIGAYDEVDPVQFKVNSRVGHYKSELINNLELFGHATKGSLQGEGVAFFSVSGKASASTWSILKDLKMVFIPENRESLASELNNFLNDNQVAVHDVDLLISGISGDIVNDKLLTSLAEKEFHETPQVCFKHLCGEYCTASAFGVWLGASILKKQTVPPVVKFNELGRPGPVKTVLLINQYMGRNYSFILLARA